MLFFSVIIVHVVVARFAPASLILPVSLMKIVSHIRPIAKIFKAMCIPQILILSCELSPTLTALDEDQHQHYHNQQHVHSDLLLVY